MSAPGSSPLDFFPLNLESGPEFLAVYALIGVLGVVAAKLAQSVFLDLADRTAPDSEPTSAARHLTLAIGHFPRPAEVLAVAYLRSGREGVAEAILARAVAEGLLVPAYEGHLEVMSGHQRYSEQTHALSLQLPHGTVSVRGAQACARRVAGLHEARLHGELRARGLVRPAMRLALGVGIHAAVAAGVPRRYWLRSHPM